MKMFDKLLNDVKRDCEKEDNCFNPDGCDKENCKCFHRYCNKYKWIIDRAKHYGQKLGIPWEQILSSWEEDRNYWYMNYYQDCNQPLINSNNVFVFDSVEEFQQKAGNKFICPSCHKISTDPYECNAGDCNWKSYGLFQFDLAFVYCKKERKGAKMFMPLALKEREQE